MGSYGLFSYVLVLHVIYILHLCGVSEHLGQLLMVKLDLGLKFNVRKKLGYFNNYRCVYVLLSIESCPSGQTSRDPYESKKLLTLELFQRKDKIYTALENWEWVQSCSNWSEGTCHNISKQLEWRGNQMGFWISDSLWLSRIFSALVNIYLVLTIKHMHIIRCREWRHVSTLE